MADTPPIFALHFDGQSTYISGIGTASELDLVNHDFTVEVWLRLDDVSGEQTVFGLDSGQGLHLFIRDGVPVFGGDEGDAELVGTTQLSSDVWYHIVWQTSLAYSGVGDIIRSGLRDIIVNRGQPDTTYHADHLKGDGDVIIGRQGAARYFKGDMAELRIWNYARVDEDIKADSQHRLTGSEKGLTAYLRLDEGMGTIITNLSDRQYCNLDGVLSGSPQWLPPLTYNVGHHYVLTFNSGEDAIIIDPFQGFPTNALTFECWLRLDEKKDSSIVSHLQDSTADFAVRVSPNKIGVNIVGNASETSVAYDDGVWHHLAVTWQSTTGKLTIYKDGERQEQDTLSTNKKFSREGHVQLGSTSVLGTGDPPVFKGAITEVRLWLTARSEPDIAKSWNRRLTDDEIKVAESTLVGYWPLNNGPDISVPDRSSRQQAGHFNGPVWQDRTLLFAGWDVIDITMPVPTTEATHELWFRTKTPDYGIFSVRGGDDRADRYIYLSDGDLHVNIQDTAPPAVYNSTEESIQTSGINFADDEWHHVAHVYGATVDGQQLYVDGVLRASGKKSASGLPGQSGIKLGYQGFKGYIRDVRLWHKAFTIDEVNHWRIRRPVGQESDLLGCWHLDEGRLNVIPDWSGNGHEAYFTGPRWQAFDLPPINPAVGPTLFLDGVDDQIRIDDFRWPGAGPVTVEFWAKVERVSDHNGLLFSVGNQSGSNYFEGVISPNGDDNIIKWYYGESGNMASTHFNDYFGNWTHIALVAEGKVGGLHQIYLNATPMLENAVQQAATAGPQDRLMGLTLGSFEGYYGQGYVAEFRVWRTVRSPNAIRADMNRRLKGDEPDLVGYWPLLSAETITSDGQQQHITPDGMQSHPSQIITQQTFPWIQFPSPFTESGPPAALVPKTMVTPELTTTPDIGALKALTFNGTSTYLQLGTAEELGLTGANDFTVEFWLRLDVVEDRRPLLSVRGWYTDHDHSIRFHAGDDHLNSTGWLLAEMWYHIAFVYTNTNSIRKLDIWINGVVCEAAWYLDPLSASGDVIFGHRDGDNYYKGALAELRTWNQARTGTQINATMQHRLTGTENGLTGYWPLDERAGAAVTNHRRRSQYPGFLMGNLAWQPPLTWDTHHQRVLSFDGANNQITIDPFQGFPTDALTFECWLRFDDTKEMGIVSLGQDQTDFTLNKVFRDKEEQKNQFVVYINGDASELTIAVVDDGLWHHLALTWDNQSGQLRLYRDGENLQQSDNSSLVQNKTIAAGEASLVLGYFNGGHFKGAMTEMRLWSTIRSETDIQQSWSRRLTQNEVRAAKTTLVGYWPLNDGPTNIATDLSAFNQPGSFSSLTWRDRTLLFNDDKDVIKADIDFPDTEFTLEFWFRTTDSDCGLLSVGPDTGYDRGVYLSNGQLNVLWEPPQDQGNSPLSPSAVTVADNAWHHVAFIFGPSVNGKRLYVDGKLVAHDQTVTSGFPDQKELAIGWSSHAQNKSFTGMLREVRIWNKTFQGDTDIRTLMGTRVRGDEAKLLACWHLDKGIVGPIEDCSPAHHPTLLKGAPAWQDMGPLMEAANGPMLYIDGPAGQYVDIKNFEWDLDGPGPVTVEFWVKINETDTHAGSLFSVGTVSQVDNRFQVHIPYGDNYIYWDYGDANGYGRVNADFRSYYGKWTHVALVSRGDVGSSGFQQVYLNGSAKGLSKQINTSDKPNGSKLTGLILGKLTEDGRDYPSKSLLTEFRIWNNVREPEDIQADMHHRLKGNEPGLVGYWPLLQSGLSTQNKAGGKRGVAVIKDGLTGPLSQVTDAVWKRLLVPVATATTQVQPVAHFDGTAVAITIPANDAFKIDQALTVEAWIKITDTDQALYPVLSTLQAGGSGGWELRYGQGKAQFSILPDQGQPLTVQLASNDDDRDQIPDFAIPNQWCHVAVVFGAQELNLTLNGFLSTFHPHDHFTPTTVTQGLNIGHSLNAPEQFPGQIAEVRVWNIKRPDVQIQGDLFKRLSGTEDGLIGLWPLAGNTQDKGPHQLHGTAEGVIWQAGFAPLVLET